MSDAKDLLPFIKETPDFPSEGVVFRDIQPLLTHKFQEATQALLNLFSDEELAQTDHFVGLDARGFIFASALAQATDKGFVMARKAGKLPPPTIEESYALEYGEATIELQEGTGNVIIIDDVLATGGTLTAAANLCEKAGYNITGIATLINLTFLNDFEHKSHQCRSVIKYNF